MCSNMPYAQWSIAIPNILDGNPVSYLDPFGLDKIDTTTIHNELSGMITKLSILGGSLLLATIAFPALEAIWIVSVKWVGSAIVYSYDMCTANDEKEYINSFRSAVFSLSSAIVGVISPITNVVASVSENVAQEIALAAEWILGSLNDMALSFMEAANNE